MENRNTTPIAKLDIRFSVDKYKKLTDVIGLHGTENFGKFEDERRALVSGHISIHMCPGGGKQ